MNVVLCGYNWTGCKALNILLELGHNVFVYTHKASKGVPDLAFLCEKKNVPYSTEPITESNLPFQPDIIASIYYRNIIKKSVIDRVHGKIFNLHPSLLPKYRGCSSVTWALINGEKEYGYTYHYLREGIDTGNVLLQKRLIIEDWDTQLNLYERVMNESMKDFEKVLTLVEKGYNGIEQNHEEAIYYKRGCPFEGKIDSNWDDEMIDRFIRAMYFPPYPSAKINGIEVNSFQEYIDVVNSTDE
jgi:methionyl-tRNA formyltransferase